MSRSIGRRLDRLAVIYGARGCPTCRPWHTTSVVIVDPRIAPSAANAVDVSPPPPWCPDCGRRTPTITQTVVIAPEFNDDPGIGA